MIVSIVKGALSLALLYAICLSLVVGVKTLKITLKAKIAPPPVPSPAKPKKPRQRKPVKSISIDPAEVDRIYVKKAS
ncbi:MAG TPA: hypothetical protein DEV87_04330 [Clostridiales bacterium]|nr:hypothetical protein [Clostridiales bacterium]